MITNVDDLLGLPTNIPKGTFTNAEQIQGVPVDNTNIGNGKVLAYNSTNDKLEYVEGASGVSPTWGSISGTLSNQTDLQVALNGKANTSHTQEISTITNLQTTLDGKAPTSHTHTIANVTGLQTELDNKVDEIVGKSLSTNDLTNELKEQYDQAVIDKHTHTNKTLLDNIINTGLGTKYLSDNGTYQEVQGGSGVDTFVELTDTPNSYVGQEGKFIRVNPTATALEFIEGSGGGVASFTQLNDVPQSYVGQANKFVQVKSDESGLEFLSHTIPTKTSDLTNDSNFVTDSNYIHTDNNYTTIEKTKLGSIEEGAEMNVQSDWNEVSNLSDSFINNKPTIPTKISDLTNDSNFVSDSAYVHTDNNYTTTEKTKLENIQDGAEVNVNADWNSASGDSEILNKPYVLDVSTSTANPTVDYTIKNGVLSVVPTVGGASTFLDLTDTPTSYIGNESKVVSVKADGTGLEFTTPSNGGGSPYPIIRQKFLVDGEVTFSCTGGLTYTPSYTAPNRNHLIIFEYADYYEIMFNFYGKFSSGTITGNLAFTASFLLPTSIIVNDDPNFPICYGTINESVTALTGVTSYNRSTRNVFANMQIGSGLVNAKTAASLLMITNHTFVGTLKIYKNPLSTWTW